MSINIAIFFIFFLYLIWQTIFYFEIDIVPCCYFEIVYILHDRQKIYALLCTVL